MASKFPYKGSIKPRLQGVGASLAATKLGPVYFSLRLNMKGQERIYTSFMALNALFDNLNKNCRPVFAARMHYSFYVEKGLGLGSRKVYDALRIAIVKVWPKIAKEFAKYLTKLINAVVLTSTPMSMGILAHPSMALAFAQVIADATNKWATPIAKKRSPVMTGMHRDSIVALAQMPTMQELNSYQKRKSLERMAKIKG